jgi:hypothetical protein
VPKPRKAPQPVVIVPDALPFPWTRGDCLTLATPMCAACIGMGSYVARGGKLAVCKCVLRAAFRACYEYYRDCQERARYISKVTLDPMPGVQRIGCWGRKSEEYSADFYLVSKRTLWPLEWELFRLHFLDGRDWKVCCRKLRMDRGNFFHSVYRVEQKLGKVFYELRPYALCPVSDYVHGKALGVFSCLESGGWEGPRSPR